MRNNFTAFVAAITVVLGLATSVEAQTTPIFRMNCGLSGVNYPTCGFTTTVGEQSRGLYWQRSLVQGGGPAGEAVVQIDHLGTSLNTEYYSGWRWDGAPQVPQGAARYLRFKIKLRSPVNLIAADPTKSGWGGKFLILGDGIGTPTEAASSRFIANLRQSLSNASCDIPCSVTNYILRAEQNVNGPPSRIDTAQEALQPDQWHSVQYKLQSASSATATDGRIFVYLNGSNSSESTPTISSGSFNFRTATWHGSLGLGYYALTLGVGGRASFQIAAFEYDDQFDPNWAGTGSGGTSLPTRVNNVRISPGLAALPAPAFLLVWLVKRRRAQAQR